MFEKISIENYKSIKSLPDFEMKPVNILIGANNSGKSNFLDAFAFLRDTLTIEKTNGHEGRSFEGWRAAIERRGGIDSISFNQAGQFKLLCQSASFQYFLDIAPDQHGRCCQIRDESLTDIARPEMTFFSLQNGSAFMQNNEGKQLPSYPLLQITALKALLMENDIDPQALVFARKLSQIKIYDRIHTEIWSPVRTPKVSKGETILDEDGGNLVGVLHQLSENYPDFRRQLESSLRTLYPDFVRISFPSNNQGELVIRIEDKSGRSVHTSQLSDGTLKFLCLVAILRNPKPPAFIGIDEIDANLHPKMQAILADIIDEASQKTQIIASTHNPDFLSMFTPDEIVILRQHKGASEMRRFSTKGALELWLKHFGTRKLWLMGELESRW